MKEIISKKVKVVYDSDLENFLDKVGVLNEILEGQKKCKFTKKIITLENIYSIFKEGGDIKVVSDDPQAIKQFLELLNNKKKYAR